MTAIRLARGATGRAFDPEAMDAAAPMLPGASQQRAEIRRLVAWLDERFWMEVTAPLLGEHLERGGGRPGLLERDHVEQHAEADSARDDHGDDAAELPQNARRAEPGETVFGTSFQTGPGGKGLNQAVAAARAVQLVHEGRAGAVMKGHLHTEDLLRAIVKSDGGLRTRRRLSHVFCMDVPGLDHLLMITDAAINIAPELHEKVDIIQNAIDLGRALGVEVPKVAVLSAVETVNPKLPSTIEAAGWPGSREV